MPSQKKSVNLFRATPLEEKAPAQLFLGWLTTIGKAIIVFTNAITIASFAYRVYLDQQKADLKDKLATQERIILASQLFEENFRSWQTRIELLKENRKQKSLLPYLSLARESVPQGVLLESLELSPQQVKAQITADAGIAVSLFALNLSERGIGNFSLQSVKYSQGEYQVAISATPEK